jgi:hypothetical protein
MSTSATTHSRAAALRSLPGLAAALLALPALLPAQTVVTGTIAASAGGALLDGDRPAFQQRFRHHKDGFGGLEDFAVTRTAGDSLFRFEGRVLPGDDDYRLGLRWEKADAIYLAADFRQFRIFYDGSGGYFRPRDLSFVWFNEALALDRSFLSVELGSLQRDRPQWRLRYDRNTREGEKNSLRWADSNLAGQPFVPRAFVPSYLTVDEVRDIFTVEAENRTVLDAWKVGARYETTRVANRHYARRRPMETTDRHLTTNEGLDTDLFATHGYYERTFTERLRASAGGLFTTIDTNIAGSKIYGPTLDASFDPTFARRQTGDVGYYGVSGGARLKQYLGNLNFVYQPAPYWTIRPSARYEHLRQDSVAGEFDTNVGGGAALPYNVNQTATATRNAWNEFTEEVEARYTRWADVNLAVRAVLNQGTGNLAEQSILVANQATVIDRDSDYDRFGQRYTADATWYVRPGLTLAAQFNYRLKLADYRARRDNTAPVGGNRYPSFLVDQDVESRDVNVRLSWRPRPMLGFVTRYAHQRATTTSTFEQLPEIEHGRLTRSILTQTVTWNPTASLFFAGAVNLTYDQLAVPSHRLVFNSDNNYVSAALSAGYAAGKSTDLFLDLNHYRADNYTDNPAVTLPLNAGDSMQSAFLTLVHRRSEHLIYTLKCGYARNRDGTFAGLNDFNARIVYGKVQYKF